MQTPTTAPAPGAPAGSPTLFGHPVGLFTLFFAEMWERFSYYGMRALLIFYCTKGFLGASESDAKSIYGAYTALVYMTPFFGGLLADRVLGARIAVILGGILMSLGHLLMTIENELALYGALALLICGNGFFKPNISSIVGSLYPPGSTKRDAGYTIFYMGINLGAAMSPLLCAYVGERYGYHYGFGLATIGMLIGLAVFVMPTVLTQLIIGAGAIAGAVSLAYFHPDDPYTTTAHFAIAAALLAAGSIACVALSRGTLPPQAGAPPDRRRALKVLPLVLLGVVVAVPVFTLLVSGFSVVYRDDAGNPQQYVLISDQYLASIEDAGEGASELSRSLRGIAAVFLREIAKPAGLVLSVTGFLCFGYLVLAAFRMTKIPRERMFVVLILTFFQMLFWAFFEQAGSSLNLFADQNIDRVFEERLVSEADVDQTLQIQPTQEQVGYPHEGSPFTLGRLEELRKTNEAIDFTIPWPVTQEHVGMGVATRNSEIAAASFQSVNAIFILLFGLVFAAGWTWLDARGIEPSTTVKFALALAQVGLGFLVLVWGATYATPRGMIGVQWLIFCYALHTTGELCLSPVGLSMISKLTPATLVSTMMGGWFLATAFSQYLAAIIAQFTGGEHGGGGETVVQLPAERLSSYTEVFWNIGIAAVVCGGVCLCLAPLLTRWMHPEVHDEPVEAMPESAN